MPAAKIRTIRAGWFLRWGFRRGVLYGRCYFDWKRDAEKTARSFAKRGYSPKLYRVLLEPVKSSPSSLRRIVARRAGK